MGSIIKSASIVMIGSAILTGCAPHKAPLSSFTPDTELTNEEIAAGVLTPSVIWKMGRVGSSSLSPDGTTALFCVTRYNMQQNSGNTSIYTQTIDNGEPVMLVESGSDPKWSKDGKSVWFVSDQSGTVQLWSIEAQGGKARQVTDIEGGIEGYGVSPKGDKLFYTKRVKVEQRKSADIYPDMDKSRARIYDDLMARHWNYWDEGEYMHIFVADTGGKIASGRDIMENEPWDAPTAPYFDMAEIVWNNSGTEIAYTCKKLTGTEYAVSTDSDIYVYDPATGTTINICKDSQPTFGPEAGKTAMAGYDKYPVYSPDDTKIAYRSMERAGNESDKERLMVWNRETNTTEYLTKAFDYNATNVVWEGNDALLFIAPKEATHQLCRVSADSVVEVITEGDHDLNSLSTAAGRVLCELTTLSRATELYLIENGKPVQLTSINQPVYDKITMGRVEKRWIGTTDGKEMLTFVVYPPDFDPAKKYPTLLYCEGGPQSVISQGWSYRWNFQLMAAEGYVVVAPNRRGVPSFGQEWLDQISGDYSGQNIRDYLSAIDEVSKEPWCDTDRRGAVGASYGGYSVFFLAGCHQGRFKALISHCGIFDFESMYGHTEELWFVNNDYGGAYWDRQNEVAQRSYANSPHKFVDRWTAPILIITGENDFRIPYTQSLEAFTAARVRGVPARLVEFENEAHQVFKPQNSIVWNREFFGWLNKYLKE